MEMIFLNINSFFRLVSNCTLGLKYETTSIISHAETQDLTFDETDQQNHLCGFRVLNTPLMLTKI